MQKINPTLEKLQHVIVSKLIDEYFKEAKKKMPDTLMKRVVDLKLVERFKSGEIDEKDSISFCVDHKFIVNCDEILKILKTTNFG